MHRAEQIQFRSGGDIYDPLNPRFIIVYYFCAARPRPPREIERTARSRFSAERDTSYNQTREF